MRQTLHPSCGGIQSNDAKARGGRDRHVPDFHIPLTKVRLTLISLPPHETPMNRVALATGIFLLSLSYVSAACAGAWPRAQGDGFGSVSVRLGWPQDVETWSSLEPTQDYSTIYLEYGLTDKLTLGADIGHSVSGSGKTVLFLQWPLRQTDSGMQASAQLGVGLISGTRVVRPGLSVGWGLETGWISVDLVAETYLQSER